MCAFCYPYKKVERNNAYKNVDPEMVAKSTRKKLMCTFRKEMEAL